MNEQMHKAIHELTKALKDLHKSLLMLEAKKMEAEIGRKLGPYELLSASLQDPNLAWLRKMSELIVNIDTIIDETPTLSAKEASQVSAQALEVLEKPPGLIATDFWTHYSEYLGTNPDIIMLHSRVKKSVEALQPKM